MIPRYAVFVLFAATVMMTGAQAISPAPPSERVKSVILSEVKLKDATLDEAVVYLKAVLNNLEAFAHSPVNVVVLGASKQGARINLDLRDVPARLAFAQVAQIAGMKLHIEASAVVLAPLASPEPIHTRIYRVPPYFMQVGSGAK